MRTLVKRSVFLWVFLGLFAPRMVAQRDDAQRDAAPARSGKSIGNVSGRGGAVRPGCGREATLRGRRATPGSFSGHGYLQGGLKRLGCTPKPSAVPRWPAAVLSPVESEGAS